MDSRKSSFINAILPVLFLGTAAALQLISSAAYLRTKIDWELIGLSFFLTCGVYLLNRTIDKEDKFNNLPRWQFFNGRTGRSSQWIIISFIGLSFPVFFSLISQKFNVAFIFALFAVSGLFYSVKIIPIIVNHSVKWTCFKEIPIMKSLVVCMIWGSGALLITVAGGNLSFFRLDIIVIFMVFFISSLNSTITSDIRDIEGDKIRNIQTIPVLIGYQMTYKLLSSINLIAIAAALILAIKGWISINLFAFSLIVICWAGLTSLSQYWLSKKVPKTVTEILVDSESIVSAFCLGVLAFV